MAIPENLKRGMNVYCSKIGGECPHPVNPDDKYVFVMTPFEGFDSVYDTIKQAVEGIEGEKFTCERADERYTNLSIWCSRICKNIRKAKYVIVDTTGRNPNVFYELGFAHALENTKAIIITQNIKEAPFDVADLNHIEYSEKNLPYLREELKKALKDLEKEEIEEGYETKPTEEVIRELKLQLRKEEERSDKFKKEVLGSEKREREFKEHINELESIKKNPEKEAKSKITELRGTIAELKSKLEYTEKEKEKETEQLNKRLSEKEGKLKVIEEKFEEYRKSQDIRPVSDLLLRSTKKEAEASKWGARASDAYGKGEYIKAIADYTRAIELDPEYVIAYNNRGVAYVDIREYIKAIADYTRAIELDPEYVIAYYNRGVRYTRKGEYIKAIADYTRAIELDPERIFCWENLSEAKIITGKYKDALESIKKARPLAHKVEDKVICSYLECIAKKMLDMDTADCEQVLDDLLKRDFKLTWSFAEIESWIKSAEIDENKKTFVIKITDRLKEKTV